MTVDLKVVCRQIQEELEGKVEFPAFEAREITKAFFSCTAAQILMGEPAEAGQEDQDRLNALLLRRKQGEPLQYLLGEWDFYGRRFLVGPGVLIPRGDTEILIDAVLPFLREHPGARVLDLCSGSGCIAVTLACEAEDAKVQAVELSSEAFSYLQKNNRLYGEKVVLIQGDALDPQTAAGEFDLIVSNPPYLSDGEMAVLQKEVSFEPAMALSGKEDGLYFYRELTRLYKSRLAENGMLAYEIGESQRQSVINILEENGFHQIQCYYDYGNLSRVITAKKKGNR